jgi:hypothetical protein
VQGASARSIGNALKESRLCVTKRTGSRQEPVTVILTAVSTAVRGWSWVRHAQSRVRMDTTGTRLQRA